MQQEISNGTYGVFNVSDGDASSKSNASAFSSQKDGEVSGHDKKENHIDFNNSNRRLDNYHLFFSSWL